MKRKILMVGLVLALTLVLVSPVPALAAKPVGFNASGVITAIDEGNVFPAGNSGRWVVHERTIEGILSDGAITGEFELTYKANVTLATQAGNFHGRMVVNNGDYVINVNGKIEPLAFVPPYGLPMLSLSGHWNFTDGAHGNGNFNAWLVFIPDEYGHVDVIVASSINMAGKWKP
jgi:hypothetical protein